MKNAFTLIEVLAIITILGIVAVITTTVLTSVGNESKNKLYESQKEMVIDAAKKWTVEYGYKVNTTYQLSLQELYDTKYLKSNKIVDPRNKSKYLCGEVTITYNSTNGNNKYTYTYNPTAQTTC